MTFLASLWTFVKFPFFKLGALIIFLFFKKKLMITISIIALILMVGLGFVKFSNTGNPTDLVKAIAEPLINQDRLMINEVDYLKEIKNPDAFDLATSIFNILSAIWFYFYIFYYGIKFGIKSVSNQSLPHISYFFLMYILILIGRIAYNLYLASLGQNVWVNWVELIPLYGFVYVLLNAEIFLIPASRFLNRFKI